MLSSAEIIVLFTLAAICLFALYFEARVLLAALRKNDSESGQFFRKGSVRILAVALPVAVALGSIDGCLIEPDWVVVEELALSSPLIKKDLTVVQISDLHIEGYGKRHDKALRSVEEMKPDIIVLTGDYLNGSRFRYLPELEKFLSRLYAPHGVYAIEGNFEFGQCPTSLFEKLGVKWLKNESIVIEDAEICLCGLRCTWDLKPEDRNFLERTRADHEGCYKILLSHYPNHVEEPEVRGFDLYLCGHTHGGQVRLPLYGALITLSKLGKKYECGYYKYGKTHVYVNRGLGLEGGCAPRVRFLCKPEVTVIRLAPLLQ